MRSPLRAEQRTVAFDDMTKGADDEIQEGARDDNGGEQIQNQADGQRHGEAGDDAGAGSLPEHKQNAADDDGGQVGVADRCPGAVKAGLQRFIQRQPGAQLFFYPLENQDVAIDGCSNRDEKAGDGRQGERHWEQLEDGDVQKYEHNQSQIGRQSRQTIINQHERQHDDDANDAGLHA